MDEIVILYLPKINYLFFPYLNLQYDFDSKNYDDNK